MGLAMALCRWGSSTQVSSFCRFSKVIFHTSPSPQSLLVAFSNTSLKPWQDQAKPVPANDSTAKCWYQNMPCDQKAGGQPWLNLTADYRNCFMRMHSLLFFNLSKLFAKELGYIDPATHWHFSQTRNSGDIRNKREPCLETLLEPHPEPQACSEPSRNLPRTHPDTAPTH